MFPSCGRAPIQLCATGADGSECHQFILAGAPDVVCKTQFGLATLKFFDCVRFATVTVGRRLTQCIGKMDSVTHISIRMSAGRNFDRKPFGSCDEHTTLWSDRSSAPDAKPRLLWRPTTLKIICMNCLSSMETRLRNGLTRREGCSAPRRTSLRATFRKRRLTPLG
jgi:hypothetical protein